MRDTATVLDGTVAHDGELGPVVPNPLEQTVLGASFARSPMMAIATRTWAHSISDKRVMKSHSSTSAFFTTSMTVFLTQASFIPSQMRKPRFVLLENVDRLLKSPAAQRGRDFAIILSCLQSEGYSVEWRVINAAEYDMPQKRRRVFIFATNIMRKWNLEDRVLRNGVMVSAFPIENILDESRFDIAGDAFEISESLGKGKKTSPFLAAGAMRDGKVYTAKVTPRCDGAKMTLQDIILSDSEVPEGFFIPAEKIPEWEYQRSSKSEPRKTSDGFEYMYSEGKMNWPDPLDSPARTILTGGGESGASRMKHAIKGDSGRKRRLVPNELDMIQMFPRGWTDTGMTDGQRAFCMGNAFVVEIPRRIGIAITKLYRLDNSSLTESEKEL